MRTALALVLAGSLLGCATTGTARPTTRVATHKTSVAPRAVLRPGRVASVREVHHLRAGDPAKGAAIGALIGTLLFLGFFWRNPAVLYGTTTGAAVGAAVSEHSVETQAFEVRVQFDDGGYEVFAFAGPPPFQPGDAVVLTEHGLDQTAAGTR